MLIQLGIENNSLEKKNLQENKKGKTIRNKLTNILLVTDEALFCDLCVNHD